MRPCRFRIAKSGPMDGGMALWLGALILACALAAEGGGKRSSPSGAGLRISRSCDELLEAMTTTGGPADVTVLVEGTVDCSGPPPPAVNAVVNNKTLTIKPAAAGAPAMIDFGGMEGAIQLAGGARIVLRNLVLVQDAMGPDPIELRAFSASGANGGSGGRIHVDGCSILARACQAPPEADEQKVAAWNDAPAAAPPHRLPRGALAGSADRLSLGGPKIGAETVDQFGGKPLHLIVCDTAVACDVGDSPSPSLAPARHSDSRYVRHSDCQSPAKPEIKTARVPIAPSAVLVSAVSAMLFLGAGIRSRGRWMRRWAKSFGGFGCVSCRRCKYDGADGGMGGLDRNLEPLCMEVPYVNDPTMSVGSLEGMELSELQLGSPLGRGGFGRVYKAFHGDSVLAVKLIDHDSRTLADGRGEPLEALLSIQVDHPNVVKTYLKQTRGKHSVHGSSASTAPSWAPLRTSEAAREGPGTPGGSEVDGELDDLDDFSYMERNLRTSGQFGEDGDRYRTWIVMEYCDRGSLDRAIKDGIFFHDGDTRREPRFVSMLLTALDIASALAYLHSQKVVHGDLKAHNVLLKSTSADERGFFCKVGDFGLSRVILNNGTHIETFTCGTVRYMPPELLRDGLMTPAVDVYSFGMLLWEMVSGSRAFSGKHRNDIMVTVVDGRRPSIPSHCPTKFASLIRACWQQDNTRRPTFKKIVGQLQRLASTYSSPLTHNLIGMAIREEQQSVETWQGETREGRSSMDGGKARVVKAHEVQSQDPASPDRPLVASPPASSGSICSPPKNNPLWTGLPRKTEVLGNPLWGARSSPCSNPPQDPSHFSFWHMGSTPSQGKHPDPGSPGDSREEAGAHVIPMKRLPLKLPQRISADCPEPLLTSRSDSASELTSSSFRRDDPTEDATGGLIDLCPSSSASSVTVPVASSYGPGAAMPWRSVTPNYQHNVRLGNFRPRGNLDNMGLIKPRATAEAKPAVDAAKVAAVANPELSLWLTTSQGSGLGSFTALDPKAQAPLSPLSPQHPPMPSSPVPPATPPPLPNGARRSGGACAGPATHIPLLAISKITGGASEAVIKSPGYGPQGWEMQYTNGAEAVKADRHPRRPSWCTSLFDTSGSCSFRSAISATTEAGNASPGSLPWTPAASGTATPGTAKASAVGMDRFNYRLFTTDPGLGSARRDELEPGFEPLITQSDFGEIVPVAVVEGPAAKAPGPDAGGSRIPNVGNMGVASGTQSMLASGANSAMASGMTSGLASGGATGMSAMWETSDAAGELTTTQTSMLSELGPFNEVLQQWDTI
ncbi:unnamed protein product [Ostreobium quekettii]|uniref:Protein kinase domain-containing protein n=1 Tax=Ostreobium quekettii TaxID=121088 RepID=A0A8S1J2R7_9CHLO|nr:unnamed protein product [Ostreobium quekettii]